MISEETRILENEPLARFTTLRVGGPADVIVEPRTERELALTVKACDGEGVSWVVLGRGSNLLIRDGGIRGVVIRLMQGDFASLRSEEESIHCGAGVRLKNLAHFARDKGVGGLEFFEGIPGSLGGALRMNAGAMGKSTSDVFIRARVMDRQGDVHVVDAASIDHHYRSCPYFDSHIALSAQLKGHMEAPSAIRRRMDQFSRRRWETQPAAASAGCVFKNPSSIPAGRLVEELGLKGTVSGGAQISEVHGNFIINTGGASAKDVFRLIACVKETALKERGIELETEVTILGEEEKG